MIHKTKQRNPKKVSELLEVENSHMTGANPISKMLDRVTAHNKNPITVLRLVLMPERQQKM
jgi:hypothetical protein